MGTGQVPTWNVPFRRNPFFTGRESIVRQVHSLLHTGKTAALSQPPAISGLGGIGKTQTAVEYAYRYREEYHYVLWVQANTSETLLANFVALASLLRLLVHFIFDNGLYQAMDGEGVGCSITANERVFEQFGQGGVQLEAVGGYGLEDGAKMGGALADQLFGNDIGG